MRPPEGSPFLPGWRTAQDGLARIRQKFATATLPVKVLMVAAFCVLALPAGLVYAPFAVWAGRRTVAASLSVAFLAVVLWGIALVVAHTHGNLGPWVSLLALSLAVVAAAHAGPLGRWAVPCRTVAWTLGWALAASFLPLLIFPIFFPSERSTGAPLAWVTAFIVLGWRLAKSLQEGREFGRQQARGGALAAPHTPTITRRPGNRDARPANRDARPGNREGPDSRIAQATDLVRAGHPPDGSCGQPAAAAARDKAAADRPPEITVDEAMAELDAMIGLTAVKDQIRSISASIEAARRRALAGFGAEKPMQHFVFLGPPGTGKTAVARIIARIFYAFGLLETPAVVEAHRADLVGEYLGATAIKTNELVDSALGGVLFIDEAYSLVNEGDGQNDRFGNEAVQALLKRAEDDRDRLVII